MEWSSIDRLAERPPGSYLQDPEGTYLAMQRRLGVCMIDQWIPRNPLTMTAHGYEGPGPLKATCGERQVLDGIEIREGEDVLEHLERFVFPKLRAEAANFDAAALAARIVDRHRQVQEFLGPDIVKLPYDSVAFPALHYGVYGYEPYFSAFAIAPEMMERHFSLQADVAEIHNRVAARAVIEAGIERYWRLDHDVAGDRGPIVGMASMERYWLPHFARAILPLVEADFALLWHCDGNLFQLLPRLIDCGVNGAQGFQYECGMDYPAICSWRDRRGRSLIIEAGVSVTTTLPRGTAADVRRELAWLVENGPGTGLILGVSSSVTPGVPWENLQALAEGLCHYRTHGRTSPRAR